MTEEIKQFARGAIPTPRHRLAVAEPFRPVVDRAGLPESVTYVPAKLSMWGNNQYGDCVSAEEAFNKAASGAFISDSTVIQWASKHGFLNGAMLDEVMAAMVRSGMTEGGHVYGDGAGPKSVDYSNEEHLKAALTIAPVKIGIDANALPSGAGNHQGWFKLGGSPGQYQNEDHCVALAGYGPMADLFKVLGAAVPSGVDAAKVGYLLFTWSTIGVVDHDWIMSTCGEAWVRDPSTTVDGNPQPNPGPGPNPEPVPTPTPTPTPVPVPPVPMPTGLPVWELVAIGAGLLVVGFAVGRLTKK